MKMRFPVRVNAKNENRESERPREWVRAVRWRCKHKRNGIIKNGLRRTYVQIYNEIAWSSLATQCLFSCTQPHKKKSPFSVLRHAFWNWCEIQKKFVRFFFLSSMSFSMLSVFVYRLGETLLYSLLLQFVAIFNSHWPWICQTNFHC